MKKLNSDETHLVSIVTPFKNSIEYFLETYKSVIGQSYGNFEWFIVDDGSDHEQYVKLNQICKDHRVKILSNVESPGAGGARNTALRYISGEFVTFIDSDDVWDEDFISKSLSFLVENDFNSCFSGYNRYLENKSQYMHPFKPSKNVTSDIILRGCDISCLTFFGLSRFVKDHVRFGDYRARNDLYFFYYYLLESGVSHANENILATYRLGKKSISSNKIKLIKYQYAISRYVAKKTLIKSIANVIAWSVYGIIKYK